MSRQPQVATGSPAQRAWRVALALVFPVLLLPACWNSAPDPAPVAAPPADAAAPATPAAPPAGEPAPEAPKTDPLPESTEVPPPSATPSGVVFPMAAVERVNFGMSPEDISALLKVPGETVDVASDGTTSIRWMDREGLTVLAAFNKGRMTRKTLLRQTPSAVPGGTADAPEAEQGPTLAEAQYQQVTEGMTVDQINELFGLAGEPVSMSGNITLFRWSDATGSSFTARFEAGKLTRKTGLFVAKVETKDAADATEGESEPVAEGEAPLDTPEPEGESDEGIVLHAGEPAPSPAPEAPLPAEAPLAVPDRSSQVRIARKPPVVDPETGEEKPRVSVNEARRREAKLPKFKRSLRNGDYEIEIVNTGDTPMKAGLRKDAEGLDLKIPPGQARTARVGRGSYTLYFVREDDPNTLHQGPGITVDGAFNTDLQVRVMDTSYSVEGLDTAPY